MKSISNNKIFKIVKTVFNVVIGLFIVLFLLAVCLQRFSGNKLSIFNFRMFTVASESMLPLYEIGDVLISKEVPEEDIKIGDNISYLGKSGDFKDKVITHKVVDIETDEEEKRIFHTQGIANLVEDPVIRGDQIYGKVIYKAVLLSLVYKLIATKYGLLIFIIIPIFYIVGSEIISILLAKEEKRREK